MITWNCFCCYGFYQLVTPQWAFTYSKLTIETLEQGVKYVLSRKSYNDETWHSCILPKEDPKAM